MLAIERLVKICGLIAIGVALSLAVYVNYQLPDSTTVSHSSVVVVVNGSGVDNAQRHFAFGTECVIEVGGLVEALAFVGEVPLKLYTAPDLDLRTPSSCPSGTIFVAEPAQEF